MKYPLGTTKEEEINEIKKKLKSWVFDILRIIWRTKNAVKWYKKKKPGRYFYYDE